MVMKRGMERAVGRRQKAVSKRQKAGRPEAESRNQKAEIFSRDSGGKPPFCIDRGHGEQVFGDMVYTF
jgi:hypothetical protein